MHFLFSMSSSMIHGVSRDAERIARLIGRRVREDPASARQTHRASYGEATP